MTNTHIALLTSLAFSSLLAGCLSGPGEPTPSDPVTTTAGKGDSSGSVCWNGVAPRPAAEPVPGPTIGVAMSQWKAELSTWLESSGHGGSVAAYLDATSIVNQLCSSDSECDTGIAEFQGFCRMYYVGQCALRGVDATTAPAPPTFSCLDYTCGAGFGCEQEASTLGVSCLLNRCGGGGSGGGGHH